MAIVLGVMIGAGLFLFHAAFLVPLPASLTNANPDPTAVAYRDTVRALGGAGVAVLDAAIGLSVTAAWWFGAAKADVPDGTRRGLFLFAVVFLAVWLAFSIFTIQYFRYLG